MKFNWLRMGVLSLAMCFLLGATGCTTVVLNTGRLIKEDRSTQSQLTDTKIQASITSSLAEKDSNLLIDVNVDVWEQRVLLTGTVADKNIKNEVVRLVRADKRVTRVYDEIQVVSADDQAQRRKAQQSATQSAPERSDSVGTDFWIETKIAAQLVSAADVASVNYRWRTVRRTTYLIGRAQSRSELKMVLDIINGTTGVTQVKTFVEIKPI